MSSGRVRKAEGHARAPEEDPGAPPAAPTDDGAIEIIEVVGVDDETGAATPARSPARPAPEEAPPPAPSGRPRDIEEALQEKERYYDLLLRKQAEFDNFRKRIERERAEGQAAAAAELVKRLLPVLDNLERGLQISAGESEALRQGLVLIHQQLLDALAREGVKAVDALGANFDPRIHHAVEVVDVQGFEQGRILEEMQRGYTINGRLLRPAMVRVASGRAPRAATGGSDPAA